MNTLKTIWQIVYGLLSYLRLALELFWEEYGDTIYLGTVKFLLAVYQFSNELHQRGKDTRKFVNRLSAQWSDRLYFYTAGFYS